MSDKEKFDKGMDTVEKIIQKQKSGLPKIPIKERMKMAIENPNKYTPSDLSDLWNEWKAYLLDLKTINKENKEKLKLVHKFEQVVDNKYNTNWKTMLKLSKIKKAPHAIKTKIKKE